MPLVQNIIFFVKTHLIFVIILAIYMVLWINKILYEIRIFLFDLNGLKQKGKSGVAAMRTKMTRDGTQRYASQIANGIVQAVQNHADEEIL